MYYLIYISTAVRPMRQLDLIDILTKSRDKNLQNNITGLLLYAQGTFIQVLEGDQEDVLATYYDITKDDRHKNIIKLVTGPLEKRVFPKWSMGFASVSTEKLKEIEGYINPDSEMFNPDLSHPAITVLKAFTDTNRLASQL
jgi:hypothetical protein